MVTREHTEIAFAVNQAVNQATVKALERMGLERAIDQYANADIDVNGKKKQPDMGLGPRRTPRGCKKRPTVILEAGVSETEAKRRRDADLWLDPNRGNANVVITIKLNHKKALVKIDKWVWDGANGTSVLSQHIEVSENDLDEVKLSGGPLTIPFNLLFLREPEVTRKPIIHEGDGRSYEKQSLPGVCLEMDPLTLGPSSTANPPSSLINQAPPPHRMVTPPWWAPKQPILPPAASDPVEPALREVSALNERLTDAEDIISRQESELDHVVGCYSVYHEE
ncbi:hypothetical protein N7516_005333 [Penicillium verrucosum]|uniref:uncharacterized protein n=1 Tax=Penicillium verrucosum TaxID=60171 RepID=UPI0025455A9D|nr:uncharacterized protein N7516_005333 [Penicillium verrucosum]KAJ5945165.1 hypothetical protein N7516_005333 [Penicillium verrucosum]